MNNFTYYTVLSKRDIPVKYLILDESGNSIDFTPEFKHSIQQTNEKIKKQFEQQVSSLLAGLQHE